MTEDKLRVKETEKLLLGFMNLIREHYSQGPRSRVRVFEVLNALAYATATVLGGTADQDGTPFSPRAEGFFAVALQDAKANLTRSTS
jgi:hypothetical protein